MAKFKKMDGSMLLNLRRDCQAELSKLSTVKIEDDQIVRDAHTARVAELQNEKDEIDVALGEKGNELNLSNTVSHTDGHGYELNRLMASVRGALDKVGNFKQLTIVFIDFTVFSYVMGQ